MEIFSILVGHKLGDAPDCDQVSAMSNRMVAALAPAMAVVIVAVGLVAWHSAHGLAPITLVEVSQVCLFLDKICFLNSRRCYSPSGSLQGFVMCLV